MTKEQIDQLIDMNCDKLAPEFIPQIRERLENVDEGVAQAAFSGLKGGTLMTFILGSSEVSALIVSCLATQA